MGKKRFQSHFRKLNTKEAKGHPHYVFDETKTNYKSVGITKQTRTKGVDNIGPFKNANPKLKVSMYLKPYVDSVGKKFYGKRLNGWKISEEAKKAVDKIISGDCVSKVKKEKFGVSKKSKKYKKRKECGRT